MRIFDIFEALVGRIQNIRQKDDYWWPNSGSFEVVVGAILTQQTKWENVEKSLENLKTKNLLSLEELASCNTDILASTIMPSGFYNMKAIRLKMLCKAIVDVFEGFENFKLSVSREWLLKQKGLGPETTDTILCYACKRDFMVIDSYTFRLLSAEIGIDDMPYDELRELLESEIASNYEKASKLLQLNNPSLCHIFAIFHGLIVEFCKISFKGQAQRVMLFE